MRIRTIPWTILRAQYRVAVWPARFFEGQVIHRLSEQAPTRLLYERAIGALDTTVGIVLGDRALEEAGIGRIERAAGVDDATHLDELAARRLRQDGLSADGKSTRVTETVRS
ncbi:MAG: hypothetical protein SW019_11020 [Actinomycetota bacterium]|nr:hypothetical protein [Actinomycetota bacterium]